MPKLLLIHPDGRVVEVQDTPPRHTDLVALIQRNTGDDSALIKHVPVVYRGRRAHAFVHDSSLISNEIRQALDLPMNRKATLVYHNSTRLQQRIDTYDDLSKDVEISPERWKDYYGNQPCIHGPMLLYPGSLPMWEPEGAPWSDYELSSPPFAASPRRSATG